MSDQAQNVSQSGGDNASMEKVLIVEDDKVGLEFIREMLHKAGYHIHTAQDGVHCLESVADLNPDLILMDVVMPKMNGIEACKRLKSEPVSERIPVIFVTGSTDDKTLKEAFDAGASDFVSKPVRQVELLARVRTVLNQQLMMRRLAEKEKLKGVLETAGGVCHELNQPLQYILGVVQLLLMDVSPEDEIYNYLDSVRQSVEQIGMITKKLTEITHLKTIKYTEERDIVDIRQSISFSQ